MFINKEIYSYFFIYKKWNVIKMDFYMFGKYVSLIDLFLNN